MNPFEHLSDDDLLAQSGHTVRTSHLKKLANPFKCWVELETPLTPAEVTACLERGEEALTHTPLWTAQLYGSKADRITPEESRQRHIQKIAYFVKHGFQDPLHIDVGVPSMGCQPEHIVDDGNHRLAAAILRRQKTVFIKLSGSMDEAKEMGLFNPNLQEQELWRRFDEKQNRRDATKQVKPRT